MKWKIVRSAIDEEEDFPTKIECKKRVLKVICETKLAPPDDMTFLQDVINIPNKHGYTPLMIAVQNGRSELIIKLVENAADITPVLDLKDTGRFNALLLSLNFGLPKLTCEAYAALIHPSTVHVIDLFGDTPLHRAAESGQVEVMEMLIKAGADLTIRNSIGQSPLMSGLEYFAPLSPDSLSKLITPSTVNLSGNFGDTPLHFAVVDGQEEVVEMLIKAGADVAMRNRNGKTALHFALVERGFWENPEAISQLIPDNVDIDSQEIVQYLCALVAMHRHSAAPDSASITAAALSKLLLCAKRQDYFLMCDLQISSLRNQLTYEISPKASTHISLNYLSRLKLSDLHVISLLVRKGLGGTTSLHCSAALSVYKAEGGRCGSTDEESNAGFESAAEEANELDALFVGPLSLFDQCAFTIRVCVQGPKHKMIPQLPLPKLIKDKLMFVEFSQEISDLL